MEIKNNTEQSLIQSKLNSLDIPKKVQRQYSTEEKAKIADTARGFEAIFVNMMYKGMKEAMLDSMKDNSSENMSFGADTLSGLSNMAFAEQISKTGQGIGIAEMLFKQLTCDTLDKNTIQTTTKISNNTNNTPITKNIFNIKGNNTIESHNGNFMNRVENRLNNYSDTIKQAAEKYNLPESLIKSVITAESAGNPQAVSSVGAKGLMQLMDGTAKSLGVKNSFDPHQNIMGGSKYLRQMLDKFGELDLAVAAYNAGPGNVSKYNGIPPFKETQAYVKKVKSYFNTYQTNKA